MKICGAVALIAVCIQISQIKTFNEYKAPTTSTTQIERYDPYKTVYDYFTTYKRTVYGRNIGHRNMALS